MTNIINILTNIRGRINMQVANRYIDFMVQARKRWILVSNIQRDW